MNTSVRTGQEAALHEAAVAAGGAPSIHNTQPWRWRIHDGVADLRADMRRHLAATDPQRHMLMVSCGAALHYALASLAAEGFIADVEYFPDPDDPDLLARVTITSRTPVTPAAIRMVQTMAVRHTDRRPLLDEPVSTQAVAALRTAAAGYGIGLDVLRHDEVIDLAVAVAHGQEGSLADDDTRREMLEWTVGPHPEGAGMPGGVIPQEPPQTTVPVRDFGLPGTMPVPGGHDQAADYAILYGYDDEPATWLRAGQALAALWLVATEWSVAVLPLSVAAESPAARNELRRILSGVGYPCLALRLGIADPNQPTTVRTPRLPASETVEIAHAQSGGRS